MDLSSTLFLFLFLPVFLLVYLVSAQRFRLPIILVASVIFLTWGTKTALWWLVGILISGYFVGLAITRAKEKGNHSPIWLWVGVGVNVAILSFFKFVRLTVKIFLHGFTCLKTGLHPLPDWLCQLACPM